jgi:hypothetical protein
MFYSRRVYRKVEEPLFYFVILLTMFTTIYNYETDIYRVESVDSKFNSNDGWLESHRKHFGRVPTMFERKISFWK